MKDRQLKKIMQYQFEFTNEPLKLTQKVDNLINRISYANIQRPKTVKNKLAFKFVAAGISLAIIGCITLLAFLPLREIIEESEIYKTIKNAQFTPNQDYIIYDFDTDQIKPLKNQSVSDSISNDYGYYHFMVYSYEEKEMIIDMEDITPIKRLGAYSTSRNENIERQTKDNKELALYCVKNLKEQGVWEDIPYASNNLSYISSGYPTTTKAMFTVDNEGIIDIYTTSSWHILYERSTTIYDKGYRYFNKHITVNPIEDTVEAWTNQYDFYSGMEPDIPYIYVKRDTEFIVASGCDPNTYPIVSITEYKRIGDEYYGISSKYFFDKNSNNEMELTKYEVAVLFASGSNYNIFVGSRLCAVDSQYYSVYAGGDGWSYNISNLYGSYDQYGIIGSIDIGSLAGIKSFQITATGGPYPCLNSMIFEDGTIYNYVLSEPVHERIVLQNNGDKGESWITGELTFNYSYLKDNHPEFSDVLSAISLPEGVRYADGFDYSKVNDTTYYVEQVSILGIENIYENPFLIIEKLKDLYGNKLSFNPFLEEPIEE